MATIQKKSTSKQLITLSKYQHEAVGFLAARNRAILADMAGVGKSFPTIEAAERLIPGRKLLVVPNYLVGNWKKYLWEMCGCIPLVVEGTPEQKREALVEFEAAWTIVTYGFLSSWDQKKLRYPEILTLPFEAVIFDEAHRLRGRKSLRTKAAYQLVRNIPHVWCLTATPIVRDAGDLFPLLRICDRKKYTSYWRFVGDHTHLITTPWATKVGPIRDPEALKRELAPWMLRRSLEDVGIDLEQPVVKEVFIELPEDTRNAHRDAKNRFILRHPDLSDPKVIQSAGALVPILRGLTGHPPGTKNPKAEAVWQILENYPGEHVVVFTWYRESRRRLVSDLANNNVFEVRSSDPIKKREEVVQAWKDCKRGGVLVSTMSILQEGQNFQNARVLIFYEQDWLPASQEQAIGRLRRRGQTKTVHVYFLKAPRTVDETIYRVSQRRQQDIMRALVDDLFRKNL